MSLDDIEDAFVLSPIQAGMLFDSLANPTTDVYVTYVTVDLSGDVDVEMLRNAWTDVFQLHQSLRAEFHWEGLDEPLQVIQKKISLHWCDKDWQATEPENHRDALPQLIRNERSKAFDLSRAPLSRFTLIRLSKNRWTLLWTVHHLLADGLSTPTILKHVIDHYTAQSDSDSGTVDAHRIFQYSDYIAWLGAQDHKLANSYWKNFLENAEPTPMRLGRPSLSQITSTDPLDFPQVLHSFTNSETNDIKDFCQAYRITLSTFLHGLWAIIIREYSGKSLSLFASTVSGRHAEVDGMDEAVGLYLNAQPRLIRTVSTRPLVEWLADIQGAIHEGARYDYSSLGDIQKYIAKESGEHWFDSIVTVGGHPSELDIAPEDHSIIFTNIKYQSTQSHYPLAFLAFPGNCLEYSLVYDPAVFCGPDIEAMSIYTKGMVDMMLSSPDSGTESICLRYSQKRLESILPCPVPRTVAEHATIHQWIDSTCARHPNRIAIKFQHSSVTFAALMGRSNQVARLVRSRNLPGSSIVGVLFPRCPDQIAALLGVLKAGLSYLPIDASWPAAKVNEMLASAAGLVTTRELSLSVDPDDIEILLIEDAQPFSTERLAEVQTNADNLAYIMFTSGSMGKSKGVKITHDNLVYSTSARIKYYQEQEPVFVLLSSIAFDSSVAGIYWVLCGGGTLVLPGPDEEKDIDKVAKLISENNVTHSLCLPSYYRLMLHHVNSAQLESLKTVIVAGEACGTDVGILHFSRNPEARLFNEYGPTEACVWSSVHEVTSDDTQSVPIGNAIDNSLLVVLNYHGNLCPPGVAGEIHIGGPGVSPGYLNDPSLTVDRFVTYPILAEKFPVLYKTGDSGFQDSRGVTVYTGREDRQLKIRGYRIEPAEIEAVLTAHPEIEQVIVVAVGQASMTEEGSSRRELVTDVEQLIDSLQRNVNRDVLEDALTRVESMNSRPLKMESR